MEHKLDKILEQQPLRKIIFQLHQIYQEVLKEIGTEKEKGKRSVKGKENGNEKENVRKKGNGKENVKEDYKVFRDQLVRFLEVS